MIYGGQEGEGGTRTRQKEVIDGSGKEKEAGRSKQVAHIQPHASDWWVTFAMARA